MKTYRFLESAQCRVLLAARCLTQAEAQAMHAERTAALSREGWRPKDTLDLTRYLGREGQETCMRRDGSSRLLRWEEES